MPTTMEKIHNVLKKTISGAGTAMYTTENIARMIEAELTGEVKQQPIKIDVSTAQMVQDRTNQAMEARYQSLKALADFAKVSPDDMLNGRVELLEQHLAGGDISWRYRLREVVPDMVGFTAAPKVKPKPLPCVTAMEITTKERRDTYGHPADDFKRVATMWSAYTGHTFTAEQVAICMVLIKVARLSHSPGHWDSYVDGAGYFNCAGMVELRRQEEAAKSAATTTPAESKQTGALVLCKCSAADPCPRGVSGSAFRCMVSSNDPNAPTHGGK